VIYFKDIIKKEELMFELVIIFSIYLTIGFLSYKACVELKISKHIKVQEKMAKPLYDFKGQLLRQYFH
jgi:hypothetical protein